MAEWHDEPLDKRRVCQKRRRTATCPPQTLDTLPAEWRELLAHWVRRGGNSRWDTLRNDAGNTHVQMAQDLLNWLLRAGWAAVTEQRQHSEWWPQHVELLHLPQLRAALGLRDKDNDAQRWQECRALLHGLNNTALTPALFALDELPVQRALARQDLIFKLHDWQTQQQSGTRRNFALFARDDTKAVSDGEWNWLESVLDLAEFGIERHTPLLLIAAPLTLTLPNGQLDLASCADFAALTPATMHAATAASGTISRWQIVENRTSFENVAKKRDAYTGVIWLPGFPPTWLPADLVARSGRPPARPRSGSRPYRLRSRPGGHRHCAQGGRTMARTRPNVATVENGRCRPCFLARAQTADRGRQVATGRPARRNRAPRRACRTAGMDAEAG